MKSHRNSSAIPVVDTDTGFYRDRNRHHIAHRLDTVGHQLRIAHQASTKHTVLHAVGGAADVEVDLIIAARLGQLRALRAGAWGSLPPSCRATGCSSSL